MKSPTEEQKTSESKKPRFKIEKLEERIAPKRFCGRDVCYHYGHYNPHGKYVGAGNRFK
jgi:hypothetical protein